MFARIVDGSNRELASDFRAKATLGVALAALALLFPIAILDILHSRIAIGIGSLGIVAFLATNVWIVRSGRCHQNLTLFGLVPAGMLFMSGVFMDDALIGSLWCYPSIVACYCMLSQRRAWLANILILLFSLPLIFAILPTQYAWRVGATLLAVSLFSAILVHVIDEQSSRLHKMLIHDPLTGLLNRFTLKATLTKAISQSQMHGSTSSILAIDIDHFKFVNDQYGHDVGDKALREFSQLLQDNIRDTDAAFRSGGEEFLVLLNEIDKLTAKNTAQRLVKLVETTKLIPHQAVTISIGLASYTSGENWTQWMKRADESLYQAKALGRNQVVCASPLQADKTRLFDLTALGR